jgi:hypothetical protein
MTISAIQPAFTAHSGEMAAAIIKTDLARGHILYVPSIRQWMMMIIGAIPEALLKKPLP